MTSLNADYQELLSFRTANWWRFQWEQTYLVEVTAARTQDEGWADWKLWCEVCAERNVAVQAQHC